ncbi:hypothetical protein HDV00_008722 [Rhizophlyctis rosea]|nr:hypothetical protein HDV00_008722 [Rhizophlyctis rosea]
MSPTPINDLFTKASLALTGYSPDQFVFENAPLSTRKEAAQWSIAYLAIVLGGQQIMRASVQKPISIKPIFFLHNAMLSIVSAGLLLLFLELVIPDLLKNGLMWSICHEDAWSSRLELLFYINYLIKYYELLDTIFLVLKKKKLEFLHVYHHAATMVLCYFELEGRTAVSWVPVTLNLFVHVIMYYYYARTAVSSKPIWWKKYLTTLQITQFILDIFAIYLATYTYVSSAMYPDIIPNFGLGTCRGKPIAAWIGCAIITSYLGLFVQFFIKTYGDNKNKRRQAKKEVADAVGVGEKEKVVGAVKREGNASPVRRKNRTMAD